MKANVPRIIFSLFIIFIIYVIYVLFFTETKEIFDFTRLDPNDQKNVEVRAILMRDMPIEISEESNVSIFYVKDRNGKVYKVQGPSSVPNNFKEANVVIMRGHLHHDYFHASSIVGIE